MSDISAMDAIEGRSSWNRSSQKRPTGSKGGSSNFAAQVEDWVHAVQGAMEVIFKMSVQELVSQMQALVPVDTGFLRSSFVASTVPLSGVTTKNTGGQVPNDIGPQLLVISNAKLGETIYLGYTANYAAFVHYGAQGRPARPWVDIVAQRWTTIVQEKANEVKTRLGI